MKFERMCCILYYWSSWQLSLETEQENMLAWKNLHGIFVHGISASILWKQFKYVVFLSIWSFPTKLTAKYECSVAYYAAAFLLTSELLFFYLQVCYTEPWQVLPHCRTIEIPSWGTYAYLGGVLPIQNGLYRSQPSQYMVSPAIWPLLYFVLP